MLRIPILLFALLLMTSAHGSDRLIGPIEARLIKVADGDSLIVMARIWPGHDVRAHVRIDGIDTPELRGKCALERQAAIVARQTLAGLIGREKLHLRQVRKGKYFGRVIAQVATASGTRLAAGMLESGFARPYRGGKRKPWCDELLLTGQVGRD